MWAQGTREELRRRIRAGGWCRAAQGGRQSTRPLRCARGGPFIWLLSNCAPKSRRCFISYSYYLLLALIPWRAPMQKHGHASCGCWRPRPSRGCVCSAGAFHRAPSVYAHLGLTGSSAPPRYSVADVRISRRSKLAHGPFQHEFSRIPLSFLRRGSRSFGSCASWCWCTPGIRIRIDRRAPLTPSGMILNGVSVSFFQGNAELALPYGVVPTAAYLSTSPRQQHVTVRSHAHCPLTYISFPVFLRDSPHAGTGMATPG